MEIYKGHHGTCRSRAAAIKKNGFKPSGGRYGVAVYFWCKDPYSKMLAEDWWRFCCKDNRYAKEEDTGLAILGASLQVASDAFLDLTKPEVARAIREAAAFQNVKKEDAQAFIEQYIDFEAKKRGGNLKLLKTQTSPPKKSKFPILLGAPECYAVYDVFCIFEITEETPQTAPYSEVT
ncbi:hypothetical protein [Desulfobotulus sp.]|uniref:hypothetical protein n=1 Tax=Desulfobotulus sp. TaxID=1940337 RepID=UPI002A35858C|nr:hypothetical protein [Desulfobotulus sp.]MDY0164782.1 hypothetical protein [Desulfobotulus sp.]